jgi:hypothetical protein
MRQRFHRELEELERSTAAAARARAGRRGPGGVAVFRELLTREATEPHAGESPAETVARAAGISAFLLKDLLRERARETKGSSL